MLATWPPIDPSRIMQGFPRLRETIDEMYESGVLPPADIYLNDREVVVEVAASGVIPDDFQIAVTGNTVTITGQVRRELDLGEPYYQGIRRGEFHLAFALPVTVDPDTADATYCDGMLKLRLVKEAVTKPHLVRVKHESSAERSETESGEENLRREKVPVRS